MREVSLYRWRSSRGENFGDWLSVPLLVSLGYTVRDPEAGRPVLMACGSILHHPHYDRAVGRPVHVWGSGIGGGSVPDGVKIHAVRGPVTRRTLDLDPSTPLGDPALLLPQFFPAGIPAGRPLFVQHCWNTGARPEGVPYANCLNADLMLVRHISSSTFVASESLHGCIVAAAYGVPWAPCAPDGFPPRHSGVELKWQDWMEYLSLPHLTRFPRTMAEAEGWWSSTGCRGTLRPLAPLLQAFPAEAVWGS